MTGEAGAGLVRVTLNGKGEMRGVTIDPKVVDPGGYRNVAGPDRRRAPRREGEGRRRVAAEMQKVTGGMQLPPGMKLPF